MHDPESCPNKMAKQKDGTQCFWSKCNQAVVNEMPYNAAKCTVFFRFCCGFSLVVFDVRQKTQTPNIASERVWPCKPQQISFWLPVLMKVIGFRVVALFALERRCIGMKRFGRLGGKELNWGSAMQLQKNSISPRRGREIKFFGVGMGHVVSNCDSNILTIGIAEHFSTNVTQTTF